MSALKNLATFLIFLCVSLPIFAEDISKIAFATADNKKTACDNALKSAQTEALQEAGVNVFSKLKTRTSVVNEEVVERSIKEVNASSSGNVKTLSLTEETEYQSETGQITCTVVGIFTVDTSELEQQIEAINQKSENDLKNETRRATSLQKIADLEQQHQMLKNHLSTPHQFDYDDNYHCGEGLTLTDCKENFTVKMRTFLAASLANQYSIPADTLTIHESPFLIQQKLDPGLEVYYRGPLSVNATLQSNPFKSEIEENQRIINALSDESEDDFPSDGVQDDSSYDEAQDESSSDGKVGEPSLFISVGIERKPSWIISWGLNNVNIPNVDLESDIIDTSSLAGSNHVITNAKVDNATVSITDAGNFNLSLMEESYELQFAYSYSYYTYSRVNFDYTSAVNTGYSDFFYYSSRTSYSQGSASQDVVGSIDISTLMFNGLFYLSEPSGYFHPYLLLGIGNTTTKNSLHIGTRKLESTNNAVIFSAGGGVKLLLSEHFLADLSYRRLSKGTITTTEPLLASPIHKSFSMNIIGLNIAYAF